MHHGFPMRSDATARGRLAMAEIGALLQAKFANPLRFDVPITGHDAAAAL
jgi:acetyl esterase